ncbi:MAG: ATP-binding protein [Oscillospiraceae bacterium]|jgi:flagellar biosynthesis GTPase FlhF|nr:ATP-binding protein [Oscillospiraceae bacterium]
MRKIKLTSVFLSVAIGFSSCIPNAYAVDTENKKDTSNGASSTAAGDAVAVNLLANTGNAAPANQTNTSLSASVGRLLGDLSSVPTMGFWGQLFSYVTQAKTALSTVDLIAKTVAPNSEFMQLVDRIQHQFKKLRNRQVFRPHDEGMKILEEKFKEIAGQNQPKIDMTEFVSGTLLNIALRKTNPNIKTPRVRIIILSGPSGVGKTQSARMMVESMLVNPKENSMALNISCFNGGPGDAARAFLGLSPINEYYLLQGNCKRVVTVGSYFGTHEESVLVIDEFDKIDQASRNKVMEAIRTMVDKKIFYFGTDNSLSCPIKNAVVILVTNDAKENFKSAKPTEFSTNEDGTTNGGYYDKSALSRAKTVYFEELSREDLREICRADASILAEGIRKIRDIDISIHESMMDHLIDNHGGNARTIKGSIFDIINSETFKLMSMFKKTDPTFNDIRISGALKYEIRCGRDGEPFCCLRENPDNTDLDNWLDYEIAKSSVPKRLLFATELPVYQSRQQPNVENPVEIDAPDHSEEESNSKSKTLVHTPNKFSEKQVSSEKKSKKKCKRRNRQRRQQRRQKVDRYQDQFSDND